ncbi:MAG: DUF2793 domain-containing protein [Novosphingobium sp.]|uniref:DUF2793 domain-containing protein n=1 Tax=Novosphingobium sp. TaxID=1874826 RepID=UPI0032BDC63E
MRVDTLVHAAVETELAAPPAAPVDGQCWLVSSGASGGWTGKAGQIAARQAGNWIFVAPRDGMRVLNRATGQEIRYQGAWLAPGRPATPSGGATIDTEARAALAALMACLTDAGIIPAP